MSAAAADGLVERIGEAIERVGWSETARRSGVNRTMLHRCFGTQPRGGKRRGPPTLTTILRVLPALGLRLKLEELR